MRCKCCNSLDARLWKGEYYCRECRSAISLLISDDFGDEPEIVNRGWDEVDLTEIYKGSEDETYPEE